jgi:UDP-N-acetylmuramate--alanine ligase
MTAELNIQMNTSNTIKSIKEVYFIGIGGIGMSAIARYFNSIGVKVSGYDRNESELTTRLMEEGIGIHFTEDVSLIPKNADLVVYTPAIPNGHEELMYYQNNGYDVVKRSDVLEKITSETFNICIAGTHGKTTISTMIAHILRNSGYGCTAFLGGISVNYNTNFWSSKNKVCVVEADEYDRSFLKLNPDIAIITAMDADHLEIYGNKESMQDAFIAYGNKIKQDGVLIYKQELSRINEIKTKNKIGYSLQNNVADAYASNIKMENGSYVFDVTVKGKELPGIKLNIGGMHNVENAIAAITVALELEIDDNKIKNAVEQFKGVRRRFEYIIPPEVQQKGHYIKPVLIDDYAHHPEELKALLKSIRSLFNGRIITIVFQPHLFTRTRDLAADFARALDIADRIILLPIYPARELPIEDVSSEMILNKITKSDKQVMSKSELLTWFETGAKKSDKEFGEVIVVAGAGDIDALVKPVQQIIEKSW